MMLTPDEAEQATEAREPRVRSSRQIVKARRKTVVVVDDEPSIQEIVALILENEGGYEVRCASNGEEALRLLAEIRPPDLLVVDIMMPVMDGWGLLEALRRCERTAQIPVIVSSASTRPDTSALGVAKFMPKPLDYDAFLDAVDELTSFYDTDADFPESDRILAQGA